MIEAVLLPVAKAAVGWLLGTAVDKAIEGGLQAAGSDMYKAGLERLRGLFDLQFYGRKKEEFNQAKKSPKTLEEFILCEASNDSRFGQILEEIVKQLEDIRSEAGENETSRNDSISNSSVENSDFVNNRFDLDSANFSGAQGDIIIGGSKTEERFRR